MPTKKDDLTRIVGKYIRDVAPDALEAYLEQTGLTAGNLDQDTPDLRTIVESYQSNLLAIRLSSLDLLSSSSSTSTLPASSSTDERIKKSLKKKIPQEFELNQVITSVAGISAGGLLGCWVQELGQRVFDTSIAEYRATYEPKILVTSVDKTLKILHPVSGDVETSLQPHKAAILAVAVHPVWRRYIVTGSMDGSAVLTDLVTSTALQTFSHKKFVNLVSFSSDGHYLATGGHDRFVHIYKMTQSHLSLGEDELEVLDSGDKEELAGDPTLRYEERVWTGEMEGNPEAMVWTDRHLIYTIRGSCLLYFLEVPSASDKTPVEWKTKTKSFNPSPLDMHVSFSVLYLALNPEGTMVACLTGDPATTGGGERVLIYSTEVKEEEEDISGRVRGMGSTEEGERLACLWTGEVGDEYVLPRMTWIPDGSGIVTTTTSGRLNLIDLTGTIKSKFKAHGGVVNGQETSGIVRDVVAFGEADQPESWRVVSVGYDGRVQISR